MIVGFEGCRDADKGRHTLIHTEKHTTPLPHPPFLQRELIVLGGAFLHPGNVNPAAEANFFGDPQAADEVLGAGGSIKVRCHKRGGLAMLFDACAFVRARVFFG